MKNANLVKLNQKITFSRCFTASSNLKEEGITKVFIPGCSLASYSPDIVMKIYEYLKENIKDLGILLRCCAAPSKIIKDEVNFEKYYATLEEELKVHNIKEVITACQSCYKTISKESKNRKVTSLWEAIDHIGIPKQMKNKYKELNLTFALHDSCPTRKEEKIQSAIRNITKELGLKIEEFRNCKENTSCCGAGGMLLLTNRKRALKLMRKRAYEAGSSYILTYCQSCSESMKLGEKHSVHILDLLFNEEEIQTLKFNQNNTSTMKKWIHRYQCKKRIEKKY